MERTMLFFATLCTTILLAGCISIPLGDGGKIELSKDGVTIDQGEEIQSEAEDHEEKPAEKQEEEQQNVEPKEKEEVEDAITPEKEIPASNQGDEVSCQIEIVDPRGNERAIKQLAALTPPEFPILDCMLVTTVQEGYSSTYEAVTLDGGIAIEGYWADIYDQYEAYLEGAGFGPLTKSENAQEQYGNLRGSSPDYTIEMSFAQADSEELEMVKIRIILSHYDTPQE